jgi:hypothetical protein
MGYTSLVTVLHMHTYRLVSNRVTSSILVLTSVTCPHFNNVRASSNQLQTSLSQTLIHLARWRTGYVCKSCKKTVGQLVSGRRQDFDKRQGKYISNSTLVNEWAICQ